MPQSGINETALPFQFMKHKVLQFIHHSANSYIMKSLSANENELIRFADHELRLWRINTNIRF